MLKVILLPILFMGIPFMFVVCIDACETRKTGGINMGETRANIAYRLIHEEGYDRDTALRMANMEYMRARGARVDMKLHCSKCKKGYAIIKAFEDTYTKKWIRQPDDDSDVRCNVCRRVVFVEADFPYSWPDACYREY